MQHNENFDATTEALTPEMALETFDIVLENEVIKMALEDGANRRGWSPEVLRNTILMFAEDHPKNPRLKQLLEVLAHPNNDNESNLEKIEELLDLIS